MGKTWVIFCMLAMLGLGSAHAGFITSKDERKAAAVVETYPSYLSPSLRMDDILGQRGGVAKVGVRVVDAAGQVVESDRLPAKRITGFSLFGATLSQALSAALDPVNVGWVIQPHLSSTGGAAGSATAKTAAQADLANINGDLATVMDTIAEAYNVGWHYKDGRVVVSWQQVYELLVPPVKGIEGAVVNTVTQYGGTNVVHDATLGSVVFRASPRVAEQVRSRMGALIKEQRQIVYEVYAFQVDLNDNAQLGISWDKLNLNTGNWAVGVARPAGVVGDIATRFAFQSASLSLNVVLSHLKTQGDVKVLTKAVTHIASGGSTQVRSGGSERVIRTLTQTRASDGHLNAPTAEQEEIKIGLTVDLAGRVRDGTVYTDITIQLLDLLGVRETKVGDSVFQQPRTANREIKSNLRLVDGQAAILGGVVSERQEVQRTKWLFFNTGEKKTTVRSELVFYVKATVVDFEGNPL